MTQIAPDLGALLNSCDREPIRTPEAIQPHGMLAVYDPTADAVVATAGDFSMLGAATADVLGALFGETLQALAERLPNGPISVGPVAIGGYLFDVIAHRSGSYLVLEFEQSVTKVTATAALSAAQDLAARLEGAHNLVEACEHAAQAVHSLSGYERIMVYRFLADESGAVVAEARDADVPSLLNHRFPESDIPKQARDLYARNHVRVIPQSAYVPAPLEWLDDHRPAEPLDMSDCHLRSVSPIHLQYLQNMGVAASASR